MEPRDAPTIRAWKPPIPGVREVLHARFTDHAYPLHTHDAWTLFIVDDGAVRYDLGRHERLAAPSMVSVLPPHVAHDGRPAREGGYRKRVIYLEPEVLGESAVGRSVDRPVVLATGLRGEVAALHDALGCIDDALDAETRLAFVVERIRASFGLDRTPSADTAPHDAAEALRAFLDARRFDQVTLSEASTAIGSTLTQAARAFSDTFGISPHAYVIGRRLDAARTRILDGEPLADVAASVGFCDQAHLTRRFKRFLGVTPGRFARARGEGIAGRHG
jgi:AraC-like DNA-binding protein